jgi:hypothetical protein
MGVDLNVSAFPPFSGIHRTSKVQIKSGYLYASFIEINSDVCNAYFMIDAFNLTAVT